MNRLMSLLCLCLAAIAAPLVAEPGDIDAASRGVVRIVLFAQGNEELEPVSHGTGFAVTATRIVTNAHVIAEARDNSQLRIGVVPSEGEGGAFARIIAVNERNDLALIEIAPGALRLPPLSLGGAAGGTGGEVSAVGYPMNVDLAQGLGTADIFRSQPPVKSRGFLSGERPSRQFDTILHTAPIARGNSGGPLLDPCGRVLGVNSFGADSSGSDAEFYFAVSLRELIPFLRDNGVEPPVNTLPCRSIAELNAAEAELNAAEQEAARAGIAAREARLSDLREQARLTAQLEVFGERENAVLAALVAVLAAVGAGGLAAYSWQRAPEERWRAYAAGGAAVVALSGGVLAWVTRPGLGAIEERVAAAVTAAERENQGKARIVPAASGGALLCKLVPERSRVTAARTDDVDVAWSPDGCVNARTQYGLGPGGEWKRVFAADEDAAVAVNTFDPATRTLRTDRYLMGQAALAKARAARAAYTPPACGTADAATTLGEQQSALLAMLPPVPNERLVYKCAARGNENDAAAR